MDEKDETLAEMDAAAKIAEEELKQIPMENVRIIGEWWQKHYKKAGHKRLGRILIKYIKQS